MNWKRVAIAAVLCLPGTFLMGAAAVKNFGFTEIRQIRFDESEGQQKPTPQIPKNWRFVGVANGELQNNNTLWFQDSDGTIFMINGFSTGGKFILKPFMQRLETTGE